jgi:suppressor for copper-sensitivity B
MRSSTNRGPLCWAQLTLAATLLVGVPDGVQAAATAWVGNTHASARLIAAVQATGSQSTIDAGLEIRMAPGWHAYWRTPGDAGIAPTIDWKDSTNLAHTEIAWPAPTRLSTEGLETYVYPEHALLPIAVTLSDRGQPLALRASVDYAACAEICVPYHADLYLALPAGLAAPSDEAPLIAAARAKVPGSLNGAGIALVTLRAAPMGDRGALLTMRLRSTGAPFRRPDLFIEGLRRGEAGAPEVALTDDGRVVDLIVQVSGSPASALTETPLTFTFTDGAERSAEFVATTAPARGAGG